MWTLVFLGLHPFYANCVGSTAGMSFVFFVSAYKLFINNGRWIIVKFTVYLVYSAGLILGASYVISWLSGYEIWGGLLPAFIHPAVAVKFIITPFTLIINFFVTRVLIEKIKI